MDTYSVDYAGSLQHGFEFCLAAWEGVFGVCMRKPLACGGLSLCTLEALALSPTTIDRKNWRFSIHYLRNIIVKPSCESVCQNAD
jgi:hypothetical protein